MSPRSLVDNSSDRQQIERAQRILKARDREYRVALAEIANTRNGEIVFRRWSEYAALYTEVFNADPIVMAHSVGRRSLGLQILCVDWLIARPEALASMLAEKATEERHG